MFGMNVQYKKYFVFISYELKIKIVLKLFGELKLQNFFKY